MLNPKLLFLVEALDREWPDSDFNCRFKMSILSAYTAGLMDYVMEDGEIVLKLTQAGRDYHSGKRH